MSYARRSTRTLSAGTASPAAHRSSSRQYDHLDRLLCRRRRLVQRHRPCQRRPRRQGPEPLAACRRRAHTNHQATSHPCVDLHQFEGDLIAAGISLLRPTRKDDKPRPGSEFLKPLRQVIESINDPSQGTTRPRSPRRPHHRRSLYPHYFALTARSGTTTDRRHRPALTHRLQPLTPWRRSSSTGPIHFPF